jgi:putative oxidoreductase
MQDERIKQFSLNKLLFVRNAEIRQWSPLFLRLVMGYGFMVHGWAKLNHGNPAGFEKLVAQIGAPFPHVTAWIVPCIEMGGGFALILGAFTAVAAVPLICTLLVAIFTVHLKYGFSSIKTIGLTPDGPIFGPPGYEVALLYIAGLVMLIVGGAGALSVDAAISKSKTAPKNALSKASASSDK